MTGFARFMVFPVEILRREEPERDSTNDEVEESYPDSGPTVMCWAEQDSSTETRGDRDTVVDSWRFASDDERFGELEAYDRLRHDGRTYQLDGNPAPAPTPEGIHHWEAVAFHVEG